jgi:pimeloyl-ACP methyl ester carboxylesterase
MGRPKACPREDREAFCGYASAVIERKWFGELSYLHRPAEGAPSARVHFAHATGFHAGTYKSLLARLHPSIEVFALDQRGHGRSKAEARPKKLRSWDVYRDDLVAFLDALGGDLVLAGHSMGGIVSLGAEAARPEKVRGILLIEPVMIPRPARFIFGLLQPLGAGWRIPLAKKALSRRNDFESAEEAYESWRDRPIFASWEEPFLRDYVEDAFEDDPARGGVRLTCAPEWEARTFAYSNPRYMRWVKAGACPLTLMRAGKGTTCPERSRDDVLAARPGTRDVLLPECSHFVPMEQPDRVITALEELALGGAATKFVGPARAKP